MRGTEETLARVHLELAHDYEFTASFPDLPLAGRLATDEAPPLGRGHGPNPAALLAVAIGNCLAASLAFCLRKSHAHVDRVTADVTARIVRNAQGRLRIKDVEVTLSPGVSAEDLNRLTRCTELFEEFCIVTQSVRTGIPVSVKLQPAAAEQPAAV
jgi:organic hydroperoxide reductase OsmC/OhrA